MNTTATVVLAEIDELIGYLQQLGIFRFFGCPIDIDRLQSIRTRIAALVEAARRLPNPSQLAEESLSHVRSEDLRSVHEAIKGIEQ